MRKILIIEDNEMNREILKDILSEEYEIIEAENGAAGLEFLQSRYQEISVILLDLHMPVMDGFEFLEKVREDSQLAGVPVIVMTADENADTEERCMQLGAVEFLEKPYNPVVMFGRISNMIRMREAAQTVRFIEHDELTGLYTRQAFCHYAGRLLRENPEKQYSLFISDIRGFKLINSIYGEAAGDEILRAIAERLGSDGRMSSGIVGYYGADHFLGIFEASIVPSSDILEKILKDPMEIASVPHVILKIGVCENVSHDAPISRVIDRAIGALDTVKPSYDVHVGVYNEALSKKYEDERQMEADFRRALDAGEFKAWFQPKVDPVRRKIVGAEALVRWKKEDGSFQPPYRFIPLFEKDGLVDPLDKHMFRLVCCMQKSRLESGLECVPISVNMSRTTLLKPGTAALYREMLGETGIPAELVPIEITESSAFLSNRIGDVMKDLKESGFSLHMDDFGSGYSSLTSLGVLPFDVTKLDKSLTDTVETARGEMIIRHMLQVIHELGMKAVVEGVESAEQVQILMRLGCDAIQGYYYSKPVPQEEFERMLSGEIDLVKGK